MEYKINGVPVRVHIHYNEGRRYIIRYRDTEQDAYTISGAEEHIRHLIKKKLGASFAAIYAEYNGDLPPSITEASHDLDSYAALRETGFSLSVPAAVYGGD